MDLNSNASSSPGKNDSLVSTLKIDQMNSSNVAGLHSSSPSASNNSSPGVADDPFKAILSREPMKNKTEQSQQPQQQMSREENKNEFMFSPPKDFTSGDAVEGAMISEKAPIVQSSDENNTTEESAQTLNSQQQQQKTSSKNINDTMTSTDSKMDQSSAPIETKETVVENKNSINTQVHDSAQTGDIGTSLSASTQQTVTTTEGNKGPLATPTGEQQPNGEVKTDDQTKSDVNNRAAQVKETGKHEEEKQESPRGIVEDQIEAVTSNSADSKDDTNKLDTTASLPPIVPPQSTSMSDISSQKQSGSINSKRKAVPKFYFPCGRDSELREQKEQDVMNEFFKNQKAQRKLNGINRTEIAELVAEVVGLPTYFAGIIFSIIVDQFPRRSNSNSNGDENMKDVDGGEEGSSSSCVSGVERSAMTISGEEPWRDNNENNNSNNNVSNNNDNSTSNNNNDNNNSANNSDTRMADGDSGGGNGSISGGDMKDVAGSSADGKVVNEKEDDFISESQMREFYKSRCAGKSREMRLFQTLLGRARRNYLVPSDFRPLMRALLMCHQGLAFLHATPEFQQRYSETVIERIYFGCTRQHNGRLTLADIKRCKLLDTLMTIDEEEDINRERRYFSYEHFYVLYCRFWELDANHDLQIDKEDLMRYSSHSLTTRIVDRIFSGHARPLDAPQNAGYMSYTDFIWFCLSEEDKTSDTAIDYWFRCVDMDGDGIITMFDMEYFYKEQLHRMESFGHEPVQIKDILCQLLDMISPNIKPPMIRRRDLKKCRLAGNFFNILFNLNKFFAIEARDPLQIRQEHATPQLTDWDRFAALEYLRLSADEECDEDESWEEVGDAPNPLLAGEAPF